MKNNTTKKASAKKKLLPAAGSLLISAAMLGTSTYAWFTMSREVEVTGMQMKTKVSGNLLICATNQEEDYTTETLTQSRAALLEPVSTVKGTDGSFYYTVNAKGNGDAVEESYTLYNETNPVTGIDKLGTTGFTSSGAGKDNVDPKFNSGSGSYQISTYATDAATTYYNAYGYVDYVFFLKATGDSTNQWLKMNKCNLLYKDGAIRTPISGTGSGAEGSDIDRAWRVAVFAEDITSAAAGNGVTNTNVTENDDTAQAILTLAGANNQDNYKAVKDTATLDNVTYNTWANSTNRSLNSTAIAAGATAYYKVTVRVWLEGEDKTCTSKTYAQLTDAWKLDLGFVLDASGTSNAVTNIGSAVS